MLLYLPIHTQAGDVGASGARVHPQQHLPAFGSGPAEDVLRPLLDVGRRVANRQSGMNYNKFFETARRTCATKRSEAKRPDISTRFSVTAAALHSYLRGMDADYQTETASREREQGRISDVWAWLSIRERNRFSLLFSPSSAV